MSPLMSRSVFLLSAIGVRVETHASISAGSEFGNNARVAALAKTVGQLRKVAAWPENLAIAVPQERFAGSVVMVSKVTVSTRYAPKP